MHAQKLVYYVEARATDDENFGLAFYEWNL